VTLFDLSIGVNLGQEVGQIVVDFQSACLPSNLDRRLDVIDFATPDKEIDTSSYADVVRVLILTVSGQYDHLVYQSDNLFTIEVRLLTVDELAATQQQKFSFTGDRLSLNYSKY